MSFTRKRKIYHLDFEGTEYDGLQVKVRGLTTGEYLEIVALSAPGTAEGDKESERMLRMFSSHLDSWNLLDEDTNLPVPTTYEGVLANDYVMNTSIINAWINSMVDIPAATEKKSVSGEDTLVASIPTETL